MNICVSISARDSLKANYVGTEIKKTDYVSMVDIKKIIYSVSKL